MANSQITFEFDDASQKKSGDKKIAHENPDIPKRKRGRKSLKEMGTNAGPD